MSGRREKQRRRRRARQKRTDRLADELFERTKEEGIEIGLSRERAIEVANDSANAIRAFAQEVGEVRKEAWGVGINPYMLASIMADGLALIQESLRLVEGVEPSANVKAWLGEVEAGDAPVAFFTQVSGVITLAGAALVMLESSPYPPELMKLIRAVPLRRPVKGWNQ